MSHALVTGATGFVGTNLVEHLQRLGWDVSCLVRDRGRAEHLSKAAARICLGSLADRDSIQQAVSHADTVFHVAARVSALSDAEFQQDNVEGSRNVAEACAASDKPPKLVLVSSLAATGPSRPGTPKCEADEPRPISDYGRSKLAAERAVGSFASEVPISIVRPPIVFGQRDKSSLAIFRGVRNLGLHVVPGIRSFPVSVVHVADLCAALVLVAEQGNRIDAGSNGKANLATGTYHVAAERTIPYGELGHLAGQALSCRAAALPMPKFVMWLAGGFVELVGQLRRKPGLLNLDKVREAVAPGWECSDERIRSELGYRQAATLEERFAETARWYREAGWL